METHTPTLDQDRLLAAIADGYYSLTSLASSNDISLEQLLDWVESPRIEAILNRMRRFARRRATLVADEKRARALSTLDEITRAYEFDERNTLPARNNASLDVRRHLRENARRACSSMLREAAAHRAKGRQSTRKNKPDSVADLLASRNQPCDLPEATPPLHDLPINLSDHMIKSAASTPSRNGKHAKIHTNGTASTAAQLQSAAGACPSSCSSSSCSSSGLTACAPAPGKTTHSLAVLNNTHNANLHITPTHPRPAAEAEHVPQSAATSPPPPCSDHRHPAEQSSQSHTDPPSRPANPPGRGREA